MRSVWPIHTVVERCCQGEAREQLPVLLAQRLDEGLGFRSLGRPWSRGDDALEELQGLVNLALVERHLSETQLGRAARVDPTTALRYE